MKLEISSVRVGGHEYKTLRQALNAVHDGIEGGIDAASGRVSAELQKTLKRVADKLERKHGKAWNPGGGRDTLSRRSGQGLRDIRNSIKTLPAARLSQVSGSIEAAGHMAIHETGGTIRARNGGFLTIPLPAALSSSGVPLRERARDWDNTFSARSKRGSLLIFRREGRDVVPLYILKESIRIRPRLGLAKTLGEELPHFERRVFDEIMDEIEGEIG